VTEDAFTNDDPDDDTNHVPERVPVAGAVHGSGEDLPAAEAGGRVSGRGTVASPQGSVSRYTMDRMRELLLNDPDRRPPEPQVSASLDWAWLEHYAQPLEWTTVEDTGTRDWAPRLAVYSGSLTGRISRAMPLSWYNIYVEPIEPIDMGDHMTFVQLSDREVSTFDSSRVDPSYGRRLRCFASMVHWVTDPESRLLGAALRDERAVFLSPESGSMTYSELYDWISTSQSEAAATVRDALSKWTLRLGSGDRPTYRAGSIERPQQRSVRDPDLPPALQDLGDEINEDIREALVGLDDPDAYYPGVDSGIEPVSDDHVRLVIWAMQRELDRELRAIGAGGIPLPAAPLEQLPWRFQRALAERRRLRYAQWGITGEVWRSGSWSLWDVPEDEAYIPRRAKRLWWPRGEQSPEVVSWWDSVMASG